MSEWHTWHVQVVVITGDNKLTAEAICRKVGVFAVDDDLRGKSITGVEFSKMSMADRRAFLDTTEGACFSRAEPRHKQVWYRSAAFLAVMLLMLLHIVTLALAFLYQTLLCDSRHMKHNYLVYVPLLEQHC